MLECLKFIFKLILEFLYMLFDIDIGFTSLGTLMCVSFIFLPMIISFLDFLKSSSCDSSILSYFTYRDRKGGKEK